MDNEYTPTTKQVREAWGYWRHDPGVLPEDVAFAEFDRWLAQVKADAWREGYIDGRRQDAEGDDGPRFTNPYHEEQA